MLGCDVFFWISLLGDVDAIEPSQDFCFYVLTFLTPHRALNVSIQKKQLGTQQASLGGDRLSQGNIGSADTRVCEGNS